MSGSSTIPIGARADSEESIEAFNMDVNEIEKYVSIWPRTLTADFSSRDHLGLVRKTRCDSISLLVSGDNGDSLTTSLTTLVPSSVCKYAAALNVKLERCSGIYAFECRLG
jgi:hypothetical protein